MNLEKMLENLIDKLHGWGNALFLMLPNSLSRSWC